MFYRLYFTIIYNDHFNILIYWFYWACNLYEFYDFSKAQSLGSLKVMQMHRNCRVTYDI
jgi:hypothetical protein